MSFAKNADFWVENKLNVLFRGKHGVGKTAVVIETFNRHKLRWKYFSASTLDPWVDFVGVPREATDEKGNVYLDLVRPKEFAADEVEAIMIDEYNRGAKKVKNAVMELLQFKSINGKRFNNLRMVWAAINPDDDADNSYDVDKMDPAQLDRFHVHVDVPYQPDLDFFVGKYGTEIGNGACEWWNGQKDDVKKIVSPRRLDYAVGIFGAGGDLKDVLPNGVNLKELEKRIRSGSFLSGLKAKLGGGKKADVKAFVNDENTFKGIEALFDKMK